MVKKHGDARDMSPLGLSLFGLPFLGAGTYFVLMSLDAVPYDPASVHAPMWVLGLAGLVFALPGALMQYYAIVKVFRPNWVAGEFEPGGWFVGSSITTAFAAIGLWIALGTDGSDIEGPGGPMTGRIAFGLGGLMCAVIAVYFWLYGLKKIGAMLSAVDESGGGGLSEASDER